MTGKIAAIPGCRIYEVGISYFGRTYEEGKKTGWRDGVRAAWCIWKYRPARLRRAAVRLPHLQPASKMSPERPTESSPLDDFASEIAPTESCDVRHVRRATRATCDVRTCGTCDVLEGLSP